MVVREYALDQLERKVLRKYSSRRNLRTLSVTQQTEVLEDSKRVARSGPSAYGTISGRVIDSSLLESSVRRSSSRTLSTTNMTN